MPKRRSRPRKPGARGSGGARTLRAVRAPTAEVARLRGPFLAWLRTHGLPAHIDPVALWDDVVSTVSLATDRAGLTDLTSWSAEQIEALAAAAHGDDAEALAVLPLLLAFLGDTGHWAGPPAELDTALAAAEEATSPVAEVLAELADVRVDPAAEDAALRGLPVVTQAEALLRFLIPRRRVTSTGALRRADIAAAAALVGVDLGDRTPRSMWDVARLPDLWAALRAVGLLAVTPTEATPAPLAHGWLTGDVEQGRQARLLVAGGYLAALVTTRPKAPWLPDPVEFLLPVLAAAAVGRPLPTALAFESTGELLRTAVGPGAGGSADDVARVGSLAAWPLRRLVDQLAADGFLQVSDTVAAAPGLDGVLARFTAALLQAEELALSGAEDLPDPDPDLAGRAYRLRIELADARPPVWREVLVDPGTPLDELHEVIQRLFDWEDAHLHEFTAVGPGRRAARFGPPDDGWLPPGEASADESLVRLSRLVGPGRGQLRYRYDFGDDWDHLVTVVGSEPADAATLPRCTAGAGAAPHEDSGGVWGWADRIEAARDPRHPEHADVREWLDLAEGETLDPTAFDLGAADARLAALRGPRGRHGPGR